MSFAAKDPCDALKGTPGYEYCARDNDGGGPPDGGPASGGDGLTGGAVTNLQDLADSLTKKIQGLVAPESTWAPEKADSWVYQQFLWLGQHLAVAIFICVVVVCALTAWQGAPRMRQLGASTGWTLAAVAGMASVPGAVMLLNKAVSSAFTVAFASDEGTLLKVIREDMEKAADAENPLSIMIIFAALVVALGFAALVFMTRNLGILAFVCLAPVVLASLARGGDTSALKAWMVRLLGLMFAPFALLLVSPFVKFTEGALVMDAVLLVAADVLMLRMIFHGVPYFGPRLAGAARMAVERRTESPLARAVMRAGAPDVYEQESTPRYPGTVDTPGRAMSQDRGVLFGAYGLAKHDRPGRLTTESARAKVARDTARTEQIRAARQAARTTARPAPNGGPTQQSQQPAASRAVPSQAPAPQPASNPPTNP
ncbi:hypothetical protein ABVB69_32355 [Streptomyces sp. NPDC000349]|uniref:hypothetical protein n=1 Tax=unclassified Streptomyces TaxID=2593676 RepID=UPI00277F8162|nr:hypothetical protein [Streptomyces sp. DSM 40167]MDQ0408854.1 hypothetical protein [Streptomyces sp. DSM 40167]